jgi:hypothetical protein
MGGFPAGPPAKNGPTKKIGAPRMEERQRFIQETLNYSPIMPEPAAIYNNDFVGKNEMNCTSLLEE